MARKRKSITDIASQLERIRATIIKTRGVDGTPNDIKRYHRSRMIASRYIENIRRATGMTNHEAAGNRFAGTQNENERQWPGNHGPGFIFHDDDPKVSRSTYMGLTNG